MIGVQPTGMVPGLVISGVVHEGLMVTFDGQPAELAIVVDGRIVAKGKDVADEAESVSINLYRAFLEGTGHLRVYSVEPPPAPSADHPLPRPRRRGRPPKTGAASEATP